MKTTSRHTIITALAAMAALLTATATALGAQETGSRYEGSVSVHYSYILSMGINTVHGIRMAGDSWFVGGAASVEYGFPYGMETFIGFMPRWFYANGSKVDAYLGCAVGPELRTGSYRGSAYPPSMLPELNYTVEAALVPELGLGVRLRNGNFLDFAMMLNVSFELFDSYNDFYESVQNHAAEVFLSLKPSLSIGYRF